MKALRRARDLGIQITERRSMRLAHHEIMGRMAVSVIWERAKEDHLGSYGILVILLTIKGSLRKSWYTGNTVELCALLKVHRGCYKEWVQSQRSLRGYLHGGDLD